MKLFTLLSLITLLSFNSQYILAQTNNSNNSNTNKFKTIFPGNDSKTKVSGFGAINMDLGKISDKTGFNMGVDMAVLMNQSFYFGIYGRTLLSFPEYNFEYYESDTNINITATRRAFFTHGGIIIGGIFYPNKPLHFGLSTKIGGGAIGTFNTSKEHISDKTNYNKDNWGTGPLLVITPQLDVEMNINYWFKFRLAIGYQWVSGASIMYKYKQTDGTIIDKTLIKPSNLSSPYISLGLVFGWFK